MKIRKLIACALCVLLLLGLSGCAKAMDNGITNDAVGSAPGDYIAKEESSADTNSTSALPENRKLIQTVDMQVETENLDTVLQQIDSRVAELGGYTESANIQNGSAYSGSRYRSAAITLRIPAKDLDSFIDKVGQISNVVSSQKKVEDVTLSYVATESRMKALQTEEARLLELLAQAESLSDLLTIEERLTQVRTELEQVTSALRVFDNQVDYATIRLNVREVTEFTENTEPETVWQRIGVGLKKSLKGVGNFLEDLFVFLIVSIPYFALIVVIALSILFTIRGSIKRRRKRQAKEKADA